MQKKIFCTFLKISGFIALLAVPTKIFAQTEQLLAYSIPINTFLWGIFTQLLTTIAGILFSGNAIQLAITNPQLVSMESEFVKMGLTVTQSLANILLIAVFIAIAIGYVFKVETFNSKKSIINFFIAALLVNFGPLFVGMIIDISNIATTSVIVGGDMVIKNTCEQIAKELFGVAFPIAGKFALEQAVSWIPAVGQAKVVLQISTMLLGSGYIFYALPNILVKLMIGQLFGALMFSYAIFFLTRIFMLQLLAVLSPLAILSRALPQTAGFFSTWFKWLTGWAIAGIMTLFLLTLGLTTIKAIQPYLMDQSTALGGGVHLFLGLSNLYWLSLCVYLICVEALVAGTIPAVSGNVEKKITGALSTTKKLGQKPGKTASTNNQAQTPSPGGRQTTLGEF